MLEQFYKVECCLEGRFKRMEQKQKKRVERVQCVFSERRHHSNYVVQIGFFAYRIAKKSEQQRQCFISHVRAALFFNVLKTPKQL